MNDNVRIKAEGLCIGYRKTTVHGSMDFELHGGQVTCLMGLNGAGKSTLIKTICGLIPPTGGRLEVDGEIGVVLTERGNAGGLSVYETVSLGRYRHTGFFGTLNENDHIIIRKALEAVGISEKADCFVSETSDGERQKVFIAKALAQECPVIVLDEPTAFLDVKSRIETMLLLRRLAHEEGKAILVSTHDLDNALNYADTLWLLSRGSGMISGTPRELSENGTVEKFFELPEVQGRFLPNCQ